MIVPARKYERGQEPWTLAGMAKMTWYARQAGRTKGSYAEHAAKVAGEYAERLEERLRDAKARAEAGRSGESVAPERPVRRSWLVAVTDTFGGSWSTIQKKRAAIEEAIGYRLPKFFERGSDAERAFLLDYAHSCAPERQRPASADSVTGLSVPMQEKFEAFKRAFVREQERSFEQRVHDAAHALVDKELLARLQEREKRSAAMESAWRGVYFKDDYQLLLKVLHPDSNCGPEQVNRAFALVREKEDILLRQEVRKPRGSELMPATLAEMLARRRR